jgi:hypothetical protein
MKQGFARCEEGQEEPATERMREGLSLCGVIFSLWLCTVRHPLSGPVSYLSPDWEKDFKR